MPLALQHLGFLQRETGDLEAPWPRCAARSPLNPEDTDTAALLGAYLNEAGRAREAAAVLAGLRASATEPDLDVLMAHGAALAQVGRTQEAIATFDRALAIDPSNAAAKANLGTVYLPCATTRGRARSWRRRSPSTPTSRARTTRSG